MRSVVRTLACSLLLATTSCARPGNPAPTSPTPERDVAPPVASDPSAIPQTPAGRALQAWLEAFNSGERDRIAAYHASYEPDGSTDQTMAFRTQTGGFELVRVDESERLHVEFVVKEKGSPTQAVGRIEVEDAEPAKIVAFSLRAIPAGLTAADMDVEVDATARARVIDGVAAKLAEFYVFPDVAKKMEAALREHQERGAYDDIRDGERFAAMLTEHLRAVSHDKHLRVDCSPAVVPSDEQREAPENEAQMREQLERMNCGFAKIERIAPDIGYVKLDMFAPAAICGATATAAMKSLEGVEALVFDLRANGGGEPEMVAYLSTYLFAKRTHLNDIYERKSNKTTEYWTKPELPGKRFTKQPVFVLTSTHTFSGAEEFTYNLKNLKRATIVGQTTGGGAHPVSGHRVDDHFVVGVPFARAVNPISKTNWEGTGVAPDVEVPADQALDVATKLAHEQLAARKHGKSKRSQSP